jgi:release factor glutamine methyltransferase
VTSLPHALRDASAQLSAVSETPRVDAELLMAHALGTDRSTMLLKQAELAVPDLFASLIRRRIAHEPVAYIIGKQAFWDLDLIVTPDVLIPRADSEALIEAALEFFSPLPLAGGVGGGSMAKSYSPSPNPSRRREGDITPTRVLDLGTGSGALLLAALSAFPQATGIGIDASAAALSVANDNAKRLGFDARSEWLHRSWHDAGWTNGLGTFDLILCNPPYVEDDAVLSPMVAEHEPHDALFAGADGLNEYRVLVPQIPAMLALQGVAIFEIGHTQAQAVGDLARKAGLSTELRHDLTGKPRALRFSLGFGLSNG